MKVIILINLEGILLKKTTCECLLDTGNHPSIAKIIIVNFLVTLTLGN